VHDNPAISWAILARYLRTLIDRRARANLLFMAVIAHEKTSPSSPLDLVTANDWILIKAGARQRKFAPGDVLIRQDSAGGSLFLLRSGSARIEANGATVAKIGPGQICGEVAFLDCRLSSASVIAEEEVEADAIEWAELHRIFRMFPHVGSRFYQSLAVLLSRRLRETSSKLAQCQKN
jgi:signal-transduction protein with cAMP-binding, CBS, and nucleotidyltransferase domain